MKCPYCTDKTMNSYPTKVIDSRSWFDEARQRYYVERRRKCLHCEQRFTTKEFSPRIYVKSD